MNLLKNIFPQQTNWLLLITLFFCRSFLCEIILPFHPSPQTYTQKISLYKSTNLAGRIGWRCHFDFAVFHISCFGDHKWQQKLSLHSPGSSVFRIESRPPNFWWPYPALMNIARARIKNLTTLLLVKIDIVVVLHLARHFCVSNVFLCRM